MPKSEENDLQILIKSLKPSTAKSVRKKLKSISPKGSSIKVKLYEAVQKKTFDKTLFIKDNDLSLKRFKHLKFELFHDLIFQLKTDYSRYSYFALQNEVKEYVILMERGLYIKAIRKLNLIKKISLGKCDFNTTCFVQMEAINYRLYNYTNTLGNFNEASNELKEYQKLSEKKNAYILLNNEILNLHYKSMDARMKDRNIILQYLDHELLRDEPKEYCVISMYFYYLSKSLVYIGSNNYSEGKKYAMKAYNHLFLHPSKYRIDYFRCLIALNNYLDSSLHLSEIIPFEETYPKILQVAKSVNKNSELSNVSTFMITCSLHLNYLWLKRDYNTFSSVFEQYKKSFSKFEPSIAPHFKVEILLGFARMHFLGGNLTEAGMFCEYIAAEKSNPNTLYIVCGSLLRVMVNIDMGNYKLIAHLVNTSKYLLKKRGRLFEIELCFFNGINKLKPYYSANQKAELFMQLYKDINSKMSESEEMIIDKKINIIEWLRKKTE